MENQKKALKIALYNYEIDGDAMQCVLQEACKVLCCFLQMVKKMKQTTNLKTGIIQTSFKEEQKKAQISAKNKEEESDLKFFFNNF